VFPPLPELPISLDLEHAGFHKWTSNVRSHPRLAHKTKAALWPNHHCRGFAALKTPPTVETNLRSYKCLDPFTYDRPFLRFLIGGSVVAAFVLTGDLFRSRSSAGLFKCSSVGALFQPRRISSAARCPLAMAPWTVPLFPVTSVASPAKNSVLSTGRAHASCAPSAPTLP